jgi:hypothetical protein
MGTATREWPWPWEGYKIVRLSVGDDIMPPIRDQIVSHVAAVVGAAQSVRGLEEGVRKFRNPYLPPFDVRVMAEKDRPDSETVDIAVRAGRR